MTYSTVMYSMYLCKFQSADMDLVYQWAVDCTFSLTYLLWPGPAIENCVNLGMPGADLLGLSFVGLQEAGQVGKRRWLNQAAH